MDRMRNVIKSISIIVIGMVVPVAYHSREEKDEKNVVRLVIGK